MARRPPELHSLLDIPGTEGSIVTHQPEPLTRLGLTSELELDLQE